MHCLMEDPANLSVLLAVPFPAAASPQDPAHASRTFCWQASLAQQSAMPSAALQSCAWCLPQKRCTCTVTIEVHDARCLQPTRKLRHRQSSRGHGLPPLPPGSNSVPCGACQSRCGQHGQPCLEHVCQCSTHGQPKTATHASVCPTVQRLRLVRAPERAPLSICKYADCVRLACFVIAGLN